MKATNLINVFRVLPDGTQSSTKSNTGAGPGAFAVGFTPNGATIVLKTGSSAPNTSAASSYTVKSDGSMTPCCIPWTGASLGAIRRSNRRTRAVDSALVSPAVSAMPAQSFARPVANG
jgi:hypothetical protein